MDSISLRGLAIPYLRNATRRILKATYSPVRPEPTEIQRLGSLPRVWDKLAFIRSLGIQATEIGRLAERIRTETGNERLAGALRALGELSVDTRPGRALRMAPRLVRVEAVDLLRLGRMLVEERKATKATVEKQLETIHRTYQNQSIGPRPGVGASAAPRPAAADLEATTVERTVAPDLDAAIAMAERQRADLLTPIIARIDALAGQWRPAAASLRSRPLPDRVRQYLAWMDLFCTWTETTVDAFEERMTVEPIGRLHLERLEMMPAGIERGELVYTLPLAPKEIVNISHKEWATSTEEFEKIVQDSFEDYSEEGVSEKSDLSQSSESESRHATAYSLSANYSHFGVSASVGYNSTSDDSTGQQQSRQQSVEITRKASSRTRKDHKVSFKVTSVVGTENQEVRVITNPSATDVMRIDYFQLMRKWRVDLYRYGLRMTYDLAIPNPGADLIQRIGEIRALDDLIDRPFSFTLPLSAIDRTSWPTYAAMFGATVAAPPEDVILVGAHREYGFVSEDESDKGFADSLELDVDSDYSVDQGLVKASFANWTGHANALFDVELDAPAAALTTGGRVDYTSGLEHLIGRSGKMSVIYRGRWLSTGLVLVELRTRLKPAALERWQMSAWNAMREGAQQAYQESRRSLIERREKLAAELSQFDALTLRKMEREEVMKTVLRWLFGPDFDLLPPDIAALFTSPPGSAVDVLDPGALSAAAWQRVMEYGEFIKFIHQAIEWENVLFFIYPYFWDSPANAGLKRFLNHPDPRHREFLRGGCARVVLTVRPGFEESFTQLVQTGSFSALSVDHPYLTIAQEIRAYAETNYPGIPPANPDGSVDEEAVEAAEKGIRIGSWFEYTPTSGLDISIDTPAADLA